ncbi:MAG: hypothetical protein ACOZCL_14595 [Bacillota bacterium]
MFKSKLLRLFAIVLLVSIIPALAVIHFLTPFDIVTPIKGFFRKDASIDIEPAEES